MWIVDQKGKKLAQVHYVTVSGDEHDILGWHDSEKVYLGTYKTPTRSYQVLKELATSISNGEKIFEMPVD